MDPSGESRLKIAYCGDDCNSCPRYVATQSQDTDGLKRSARLWHKVGWRDSVVAPEEMTCHGCPSVTWCRYGTKDCAESKSVSNCAECEAYPCKRVVDAFAQTEEYAKTARVACSAAEYRVLEEAFFSKQRRLDRMNRSRMSPKGKRSPNKADAGDA